ncbi:MAG: hypothetical protein AB1750_20865 [Chloroflexota bacterium]
MRFFLKYFSLLLLSLAALTWLIPSRYGLPYPDTAGPHFSNAIRMGHSTIIDNNRVNVVLIGDSTLDRSVDEDVFSTAIGQPAHVISTPASSTALWYLILKNAIIEGTQHRPRYVLVMFRDTLLTLPDYHVAGGRVNEIDEYATAHEDLVVKTAYLNFMNPLEIFAERYFPLYGARQRIKDSIEFYTRSLLPNLFLSCKGECVNAVVTNVFYNIENIDQNFSQGFLMSEETKLYTQRAMDFDAQLDDSFLPEIIRLAQANDIRLIFVHARTLTFPTPDSQPAELAAYKRDLAAYLAARNVPLLDFSFDERFPPSLFNDPLHMNDEGRALFSQALGEAFLELTLP